MPGPGFTFSKANQTSTELEETDGTLRVEEGSTCALVLRDTVPASRGKRFRILVSASPRVDILGLDRHGPIDDRQPSAHGEGGRPAEFQVVVFVGIVFVGCWHFEWIESDVAFVWDFLDRRGSTSLLRYRLKPLLEDLLRSKMVLISYFDEPGDTVRSFVKSLFFPYPMPAPALRKVEGML